MQLKFILLLILLPLASMSQQLYEVPEHGQTRWITFENPTGAAGAAASENKGAKGHAFDVVPPHGSRTMMDVQGVGIIHRIWLTVNERSPYMLRAMRIEMYWDNAATPAVSAPLGDFFGVGLGRKVPFESELFSDPEGRSFNCYVPMPFQSAARIVLINDSDKPVNLYYDINYTELARHEKPVYYFHCYWNRENKTKLGKDFTVLPQVKGKGRFLGMNVGVIADPIYEKSWWGEGEVKIFVDDDTALPTLAGTGTEDYIGSGWGQGAFSHRYQGCTVADTVKDHWAFYRYHIPDPVYFNSQCKVTLQQIGGEMTDFVRRLHNKDARLIPVTVSGDKFHKLLEMNPVPDINSKSFPQGWTNYYREDDVSSTAYFYLDQPVNGLGEIASLSQRISGMEK